MGGVTWGAGGGEKAGRLDSESLSAYESESLSAYESEWLRQLRDEVAETSRGHLYIIVRTRQHTYAHVC